MGLPLIYILLISCYIFAIIMTPIYKGVKIYGKAQYKTTPNEQIT